MLRSRAASGLVGKFLLPSRLSYSAVATVAEEESVESSSERPSTTADPETIHAIPRERSGRLASKKARKVGRVPAILYSLPGETSRLLTLEKKDVDRLIAANGILGIVSKLFSLSVEDDAGKGHQTFPVLPKMVHRTAATGLIENVTFLYCPPDRIINVSVPIKVLGEDVSPGVKKGGFVMMLRRRVKCLCLGTTIPSDLEIDVSRLEMGDKVMLHALRLPPGVLLKEQHVNQPICKIAGRAER